MMTNEGEIRGMKYQVAPVAKPLVAVKRICQTGHRVVYDGDGSYIEHKATGKRIWLREEDGNYMLDTWVLPKEEVQKHVNINDQGFGRQP